MAVLTEYDVRKRWKEHPDLALIIPKGTILTPSAKSFLTEKKMLVQTEEEANDLLKIEATIDLVEEDVCHTAMLQTPSNQAMEALIIKWQLLQVKVLRTQRELPDEYQNTYKEEFQQIHTLVADVIESLRTLTSVSLPPTNDTNESELVSFSINLSDVELKIYELILLTQETTQATLAIFSDSFGQTTRMDLISVDKQLPLLMNRMIQTSLCQGNKGRKEVK